jgi:Cu/Ag efflux protein CusF
MARYSHRGAALLLVLSITATAIVPVRAGEPCCNIASVDAVKGTVTIKNLQTGAITTVRIRDAALLRRLKVGQKVQANGLPAR